MCELGITYMNTEATPKHKRYDEAFKRSALEHWLLSGKSVRQVASTLGVEPGRLHIAGELESGDRRLDEFSKRLDNPVVVPATLPMKFHHLFEP